MIKLTQLLKEIKVKQPNPVLDNSWLDSAYKFFKNDQDIFKNSDIKNIIIRDQSKILNLVWERYSELYRDDDIVDQDVDQNSIPSNEQEILDPNKQSGGLEDCWYFGINEFLLPYIVDHLKKTGWEHIEDTDFSKNGKEVDIFDYMEDITEYDTSPREGLYERFIEYFEQNY